MGNGNTKNLAGDYQTVLISFTVYSVLSVRMNKVHISKRCKVFDKFKKKLQSDIPCSTENLIESSKIHIYIKSDKASLGNCMSCFVSFHCLSKKTDVT